MKRRTFQRLLLYLPIFTEPDSVQLATVQKLSQNAIVSDMNLKRKSGEIK
jgi:hypothetical protein